MLRLLNRHSRRNSDLFNNARTALVSLRVHFYDIGQEPTRSRALAAQRRIDPRSREHQRKPLDAHIDARAARAPVKQDDGRHRRRGARARAGGAS